MCFFNSPKGGPWPNLHALLAGRCRDENICVLDKFVCSVFVAVVIVFCVCFVFVFFFLGGGGYFLMGLLSFSLTHQRSRHLGSMVRTSASLWKTTSGWLMYAFSFMASSSLVSFASKVRKISLRTKAL